MLTYSINILFLKKTNLINKWRAFVTTCCSQGLGLLSKVVFLRFFFGRSHHCWWFVGWLVWLWLWFPNVPSVRALRAGPVVEKTANFWHWSWTCELSRLLWNVCPNESRQRYAMWGFSRPRQLRFPLIYKCQVLIVVAYNNFKISTINFYKITGNCSLFARFKINCLLF